MGLWEPIKSAKSNPENASIVENLSPDTKAKSGAAIPVAIRHGLKTIKT